MKFKDILSEATFEGKFQRVYVGEGSKHIYIVPVDSAVSNILKLKGAIESVKWKIGAKSGSLSKLLKLFNGGKKVDIDFSNLVEQVDELIKAVAINKEPILSSEIAQEMLDELHDSGPEVWLAKHKKV